MEEAIIALLKADAGVTGQVGQRIHAGRAPQGAQPPYAIVQAVTRLPDYTMAGPSGYEERRFQIDTYAKTYSDAKLAARAIVAALSGFSGTQSGVVVQGIFLDSERDLPAVEGGDDVRRRFRTSLDFIVHHSS